MMISVTILTQNSQKHLAEVLKSLNNFSEVILIDHGSNDNTLQIAAQYSNVTVHQREFKGFGPAHNEAASLCQYNWILSVDSDEILSPALQEELNKLALDPSKVYSFPFHNFYNGKHIKGCGWYPDRHVRLYNKTRTQFTNTYVHERIITQTLQEEPLEHPIFHFSYHSIEDFIRKMQIYSDLFAQQYVGKKQSSLSKAILHGCFAFIKTLIIKRGFTDGIEGFIIAVYNANTAFYKYLKLLEANRRRKDLESSDTR